MSVTGTISPTGNEGEKISFDEVRLQEMQNLMNGADHSALDIATILKDTCEAVNVTEHVSRVVEKEFPGLNLDAKHWQLRDSGIRELAEATTWSFSFTSPDKRNFSVALRQSPDTKTDWTYHVWAPGHGF